MIWAFVFTYFIRPFEHGYMDDLIWLRVGTGFSIAVCTSYSLVAILQWWFFNKFSKWNLFLEISTYILFYAIYSATNYWYYRGPIVNGIYYFPEFFSKIILNIALILTPILFLARRYSLKLIPEKEEDITIKGDNKLDFLKIKQSDLICISNAQNYVEIYYLEGIELRTKLILSTLTRI